MMSNVIKLCGLKGRPCIDISDMEEIFLLLVCRLVWLTNIIRCETQVNAGQGG